MKNNKKIWWALVNIFITFLLLAPLLFSRYYHQVSLFIENHPNLAPFLIIGSRFASMVFAPLSGAPAIIASLVLFNWYEAWVYNLLGVILGAVSAFWIARLFREKAVANFASLEKVHLWQGRLSLAQQFLVFISFRVMTLLVFDFVSYAAGLSKLPFWMFLFSIVLIDIPVSFAFFYFGGIAISYGIYMVLFLLGLLFVGAFFVYQNFASKQHKW